MSRRHSLRACARIVLASVLFSSTGYSAIVTFKNGATVVAGANTVVNYSGTQENVRNADAASQSNNQGGWIDFPLGGDTGGHLYDGLIRFDVTALAGQYSSINSVTLRMFKYVNGELGTFNNAADRSIDVFTVPSGADGAWVEGTVGGVNGAPQNGSSCFKEPQLGNNVPWTNGWTLASNNVVVGPANGTYVNFPIDPNLVPLNPLIASWSSQAMNPGLRLAFDTPSISRKFIFGAHENPTGIEFWPELVIDYSPIPEPSSIGAIAMCVGGLLMRRARRKALPVFAAVILATSATATTRASLTMSSNLNCSHTGNLVTNGSFETGAPPDGTANLKYWATGTNSTPFALPSGWTSAGPPNNYALWGNDGTNPQRLESSHDIPDGRAALYFGNGVTATTDQPPTFNADGSIAFPAQPNFATPFGAPVTLTQTIDTVNNPAPSYKFCFWVSGEGVHGALAGLERGLLGLRVTNVLAGDPTQYLAVPNGFFNNFGVDHLYEFTFTPLNPNQNVKIEFINWGHFNLSQHGMVSFTTETVLDDVIVNAVVPEPAGATAGSVVALTMVSRFRPRR